MQQEEVHPGLLLEVQIQAMAVVVEVVVQIVEEMEDQVLLLLKFLILVQLPFQVVYLHLYRQQFLAIKFIL